MPKDLKELEITIEDNDTIRSVVLMSKILEYLKTHKDKAYSLMEIKELLKFNDTPQYINFAIKKYIYDNMSKGNKPLIRKKKMYYYYQE